MSLITVLLFCLLQLHAGLTMRPYVPRGTSHPVTVAPLAGQPGDTVSMANEGPVAPQITVAQTFRVGPTIIDLTTYDDPGQSSATPHTGPHYYLPPPMPVPLPENFWPNLNNMLSQSFRLDPHNEVHRHWLAHEDIAKDEVTAAKMVHESLLSHVASIRCPVYAMVFRWMIDANIDSNRKHDHSRAVTRFAIQMLAFRVALEPGFYHDVFLATKFGSVVGRFASAAKQLELETSYANQMDVWFDLISCLLEYGAMPLPGGPNIEKSYAMNSFLSHERRRRLVARMLRFRGKRDERPTQEELAQLVHIGNTNPDFESKSYKVVVGMMDEQVAHDWRKYVSNPYGYANRFNPPQMPSYPLWPEPRDPVATHDHTRDFGLLPIHVHKFLRKETQRWVDKIGDMTWLINEPHLSQLAPFVVRPDEPEQAQLDHQEPRSREQLMRDIATYTNIRYQLVRGVNTAGRAPSHMWSRLPIELMVEFTIITTALPDLRESMRECSDVLYHQFERYKTYGIMLERLINVNYRDFGRYVNLIHLMLPYVTTHMMDFDWQVQLLEILRNLVDLATLKPTVVFEMESRDEDLPSSSSYPERRTLRKYTQ